jgi:alkyl hydroperoxide reductase subunit F
MSSMPDPVREQSERKVDLRNIGVILPQQRKVETQPASEARLYDLIIIGGGPAGMTAAVYAARKRLVTLLVTSNLGGQTLLTSEIENYMGYQYITGKELADKFQEQVRQFPIALDLGDRVKRLTVEDQPPSPAHAERIFLATTENGKRFRGRSVIIASGKRSRTLNVPGEERLTGRGVSYCATCDAPLFAGKDVAVIGGGNSAFTAVADLISIAGKIYVVNYAYDWQADQVLLERAERSDKVSSFLGHQVVEIQGQDRVEGVVIQPREGGDTKELAVQGVFVEIGLFPNSEFAQGLVQLNSVGEVMVDDQGQTNVPGVFAAGDVTTVPEKQIIVAAGEGAKAALNAYKYLLLEARVE